jgi:hypothetical protein
MTIHLSQVLLIAALGLFVIYFFRIRSQFFDRLIYLACALAGIVLVLFPNLSTVVANFLGIGRGADLLVYLFMIASLFYAAGMRSRVRRLEDQISILVRQHALDHPLRKDDEN